MGQRKIFEFLKKNKRKYYSARELSTKLGMTSTAVWHSLKSLRKFRMVTVKSEKKQRENQMKVYKFKY